MKKRLFVIIGFVTAIAFIAAGCGQANKEPKKSEIPLLARPGEIKGEILFKCGQMPNTDICLYEDGKVTKWMPHAIGGRWVNGERVLLSPKLNSSDPKEKMYRTIYQVLDFNTRKIDFEILLKPEAIIDTIFSDQNRAIGRIAERPDQGHTDLENIFLFDRTTNELRKITHYDKKGNLISHLTLSSDENKILYGTSESMTAPEKMQIIDLDGNIVESLPFDGSSPKWSPDGKSMVFEKIYVDKVNGEVRRSTEITLYNFETKEVKRLTHYHGILMNPDFSPDGTQVVFVVWDLGGSAKNLGVVNTDGTGFKRLLSKEYVGVGVDTPDWGS